jgi:hypothetical protein
MQNVKFSHNYIKFHGVSGARDLKHLDVVTLIGVQFCSSEELPLPFVKYDTEYIGWFDGEPNGFYKLPEGNVIILFFFTGRGIFCTIRRYTKQKADYYVGSLFKEFQVIIEDDRVKTR